MIDWIDIIKKFEVVCDEHPIVKKFGYGRRDSKESLFDDYGKEFPLVWINNATFNTTEHTISYSVDMDVFSILKDSLSNADKTISDSTAIAIDIRNAFKDDLKSLNISLTPYHWELDSGEIMAGVQTQLTIETAINNCKF